MIPSTVKPRRERSEETRELELKCFDRRGQRMLAAPPVRGRLVVEYKELSLNSETFIQLSSLKSPSYHHYTLHDTASYLTDRDRHDLSIVILQYLIMSYNDSKSGSTGRPTLSQIDTRVTHTAEYKTVESSLKSQQELSVRVNRYLSGQSYQPATSTSTRPRPELVSDYLRGYVYINQSHASNQSAQGSQYSSGQSHQTPTTTRPMSELVEDYVTGKAHHDSNQSQARDT